MNTPAAMQMRYLDTLKTMAHESNSKVIFMPPTFQTGEGDVSRTLAPPPPLAKNSKFDFGVNAAALMDTVTKL